MENASRRFFYLSIAVIFFKIFAAYALPLTGDEAYFITWGRTLAPGYYDHTPMTGWVIYLLSHIYPSYVFYRLVVIAIGVFAGWLIYLAGREFYPKNAELAAYLYLLSPVHLLILPFSNDILLFVFCLTASLMFYLALKRNSLLMTLLAGIVFGFAFMSKYLAFPVYLALALYALMSSHRRKLTHLVLFSLMISLFFTQNMYYNYTHCWNNIMFNVINRTAKKPDIAANYLGFLLKFLYITTPWLIWYMLRDLRMKNLRKFFPSVMFIVPVVFYLLLSLKKGIGLHWFLIFVPYVFILAGGLRQDSLIKSVRYSLYFTAVHIVLAAAVFLMPVTLLKDRKIYPYIAAYSAPEQICKELSELDEYTLASTQYNLSSTLSVICGKDVHVMFSTSKYGRQEDFDFDIRDVSGKDAAVIFVGEPDEDIFRFFEKTDVKKFDVLGAQMSMVLGHGFRYDEYRDEYLKEIREKYYSFPSWLEPKSCTFTERYFAD
ncbi:MAG: ArnT family glycosyltransferase [Deferribacterales bacterium]